MDEDNPIQLERHKRVESGSRLVDHGNRSGEVMVDVGSGLYAIIDSIDAPRITQYTYRVRFKPSGPASAYRYQSLGNGKFRSILMHHDVIGRAPKGMVCDHVNGNALDNRRHNLRHITQRQNMQNARVRHIKDRPVKPKSSLYKGVSYSLVHKRDTLSKPWRSRIRVNGNLIDIGWFATQEEAALAYNKAAAEHFGEFACLNNIGDIK